MTKLTSHLVLSTALCLFAASSVTLPALAQATDSSTATAPTKTAPAKKAAKKRNAKRRAKLKSEASKTIEKGVEQANTNLNK